MPRTFGHVGVCEDDAHVQLVPESLNSSFQLAPVENSVEERFIRPSWRNVVADRHSNILGPRSPGAGKLSGGANPKSLDLQRLTKMDAGGQKGFRV